MEPEQLHTRPWYKPSMSRADVEEALFGQNYGAFIVRKSSKKDCLALSHINRQGAVGHAIIYVSWKGYCLENEETWHPTVSALLQTLNLDYDGDGGAHPLPTLPPTPNETSGTVNKQTKGDTAAATASSTSATAVANAAPADATTANTASNGDASQAKSTSSNTPSTSNGTGSASGGPSILTSPRADLSKYPSALEQTVAQLTTDGAKLKMGLFKLRDELLDAAFAKQFIEAGCLKLLYDICRREEGNTLAYGLDSLRVVLKFHHAADQGAISQDLLIVVMSHFESQSSAVCKASMELFLTLNQRDKDLFQQTFILFAKQRREEPLSVLVRVLKNKEVDILQKAVTLLNQALSGAGADSHDDLHRSLWRAGLYAYMPTLCKSEDRLTRTQLCAFQIHRLKSIGDRKREAYSRENARHERMLMTLWELTFPDERLTGRVSSQWSKLGFQGTDPATDFRGMGILGLDALVYFAQTYSDQWRDMIERNIKRGSREYPVAIAGINACAAIDAHFGFDKPSASGEALLLHPLLIDHWKPFEEMHALVLQVIDQVWDEMNASYMDFPNVMEAAKEHFEAAVSHYTTFREWEADVQKHKRAPPLKGEKSGRKAAKKDKKKNPRDKKGSFIGGLGGGGGGGGGGGDANGDVLKLEMDALRGEVAQLRKLSQLERPNAAAASAANVELGADIRWCRLDEAMREQVKEAQELEKTAHAGMYTATWRGETVCMKEYRDGAGVSAREEFEAEVRALGVCRHRNVLMLVAIGGVDDDEKVAPFIITELCDTNLSRLLHESSPPAFDVRLRLAASFLRGLAYLHARAAPLVHGNLTSRNLLVRTQAKEICIGSFGAHNTRISSKGCPFLPARDTSSLKEWAADVHWHADVRYLAPECLARDDAVRAPCDVYAAAVILWELGHAARPFDTLNELEVVERVFGKDERLDLKASGDAHESLNVLVAEMWHLDAAARPTARQALVRVQQMISLL